MPDVADSRVPTTQDNQPATIPQASRPIAKHGCSVNRVLKLSPLVIGLLLVGIVTGVGGLYLLQSSHSEVGDKASSSTPNIHSSSGTPTKSLSGMVLFHDKRGGLSLADAQGKNIRQIIQGDYIGFAGISKDGQTIYYTKLNPSTNKAELHRIELSNKADKQILEFDAPGYDYTKSDPITGEYDNLAKVNAQETLALLSDRQGLTSVNVISGAQKLLLKNQNENNICNFKISQDPPNLLRMLIKPAFAAVDCQAYTNPVFTNQDTAFVTVTHYEGYETLLLTPSTGTVSTAGSYDQLVYANPYGNGYIITGVNGDQLGAGLAYYATPTSAALDIFSNKNGFGDNMVNGVAWQDSKNILVLLADTNGSSSSLWKVNLDTKSKTKVGDNVHPHFSGQSFITKDGGTMLATELNRPAPNKVWAINTKTGTAKPWAPEALKVVTIIP